MSAYRSAPHLATLVLLAALSPLSINMFLPSLAKIAVDLRTDYALASLSVSGYLAVTALVQLIAGPLSDRVGRRPVLIGTLSIFAFASLICAFADNIAVFLAFRMLQGGAVAGYALSMAIVRDTRPEREAAGLLGYIAMSMAVAPMMGPVLGGVLDTAFGWRTTFHLYAALGLGLLVLVWFDLGETRARQMTDGDGAAPRVRVLLADARFWGYALCSAFSVGAFYIFVSGVPLVAKAVFDVSTATVGMFVGSITAGFATGSFIAGRLAPKVRPTTMMLAGRAIACAGLSAGLVLVFFDVLTPLTYFGSTIFAGLGNGITMPSSNAGVVSVQPRLSGSAAGLSGAFMVGCGAVLTSLTGGLLTEENAAPMLLGLMLSAAVIGLLSAAWVRFLGGD
ncbi:Bcr/CflA family efflux MFS transporter [Hwanghaeella grinnelliae]|uniref:Bcr/CflA family efflux transporter n=1 Tax=Hwanghaeella grinnelliae TaxID=2500179 RepID=A0A3S2WAG1_9PROT|nr:Bcr/CflA family efflux MFS transporter [Hwanghaeella grinnelliae]RVU37901.1 Bcr/CflA family efflux MFS transporter [Hwanghaeella grinnelliae]